MPSRCSTSPRSRPTTVRSRRSAASACEVAQGQIVTVLGANGAGKTTVLRTDLRRDGPRTRPGASSRASDIARMPPDRVMRLGICHVPEGREVFPFLTVRENLLMGAYTRRDTDGVRQRPRAVLRLLPGAEGARRPARRPAVRRRAADAGDQPRADGPAEAAAARRAVARPVADAGARRSSASSAASTRSRASPSCWSSRTPTWRCRPRDFGYVLEVGRIVLADDCAKLMQTRRHQGILPRPEGHRRPRPAALEEEAAVALTPASIPAICSPRASRRTAATSCCARRTTASGRPPPGRSSARVRARSAWA